MSESSQSGFMRGKSHFSKLITLCYEVTSLVDEQKAMDGVYFDLSKAFDIVFYDIVMEKVTSMSGEVSNEVYPELSEWSGTGPQGCNQWHKGDSKEAVSVYPWVQYWTCY